MTPFLELVAQDLYRRCGGDFSRTVIIFPNKRAGLFMNEHLLNLADGMPLWAPRYMTINELFLTMAPDLGVNDPIDTTLRIVRLFRKLTGRDVTVDWFYGWAERLLSDFDDVDKNMADSRALFQNVEDWKAYDDTSFLTEEQVKDLQRFFSEFDPQRKSELRENYKQLWNVLYDLYQQLNSELEAEHTAYEGALFRRVVERLNSGEVQLDAEVDRYVIVGFNVLDEVEKRLFTHIKKEGRALFYWDYDEYYTRSERIAEGLWQNYNEAGTFVRENLRDFPNALPAEAYRNLAEPKRLEMVSASTEAIQAQYVAPWLKKNCTEDARKTAVVLCNENLLQPVLHGLPDDIKTLNVTKGFPLSHTQVATEVERMMGEWERHKSKKPVMEMLTELAKEVESQGEAFVKHEGYSLENFEDVLQGEAYFQMYSILNRFAQVMVRYVGDAQMTIVTLRRLIRAVVRQTSIPFHGEPIEGLQVMGVLETRCLDFERILMLSVNDGTLPKRANDNSFIPYLLRKAFRLTTPERRTAVYAYYFYRLLQRAELVTMAYNTSTEGMSTGEMSRFMTQLLVEWPHGVLHFSLNSNQRTTSGTPVAVEKPDDILARLTKEGNRFPSLSPSALKIYLECELAFYFNKVMHISEPEDKSGEIKPNVFGSIFHRAAEQVYKPILEKGGHVEPDHLRLLANNKKEMHRYVKEAFEKEKVEYRVLEARVLELYLSTLLQRDAELGHFQVMGTERPGSCFVDAEYKGEKVTICMNGVIDRLDLIHDTENNCTLRVLDYKTGSTKIEGQNEISETKAASVEDIFQKGGKKGYIMQTFIYEKMLHNMARKDTQLAKLLAQHPVSPALFFIRNASQEGYDPRLKISDQWVTDVKPYAADFDMNLRALINEILDPTRKFEPTDDEKLCKNCAYRSICHKVTKG